MIPREDLEHILARTLPLWDGLRGERLFITGGTGFVGTWLVESFVYANRTLGLGASATLLTRDPERFRNKAPHVASDPAVQLLQGNSSDFSPPPGTFAFAIHAATERYFEPDPAHPLSIYECDVVSTKRVLEFARSARSRRLLFTSSGAVYGRQPPELTHVDEDYRGAPPPTSTDPVSIYGQGKRSSEFMCAMYARQYGFAATIARLFAFVGPCLPLDEQYAIGNFIGDVLAGRPVAISGDGTPYRSYLYASDLAVWLWTILFAGRSGHAYNVGSPEALTIRELADAVVRSTVPGTPVHVAKQPVPGTPAARYVPAVSRAENELGLTAAVALEEGIRKTYAWHLHAPAPRG